MGTGGDNRGLYLKNLMDTYVASIPAPSYKNFDRNDIMKQFGNGILGLTKEIDDGDSPYTVTDTDGIAIIICDTSSADVTVNLPTLSDNFGRYIKIINEDGTNDVIVTAEGTEKINSYDANVEITEKWGYWNFIGSTSQWIGETDGNSTIVYTGTETVDTGLTTTQNTWDDVNFGTLQLDQGTWQLDAFMNHYGRMTGIDDHMYLHWGLGTTSGNNAPDLFYDYVDGASTSANYMYALYIPRHANRVPAEITSASTQIYMKVLYTARQNFDRHRGFGAMDAPMYIRARRVK